MNKAVKKLWVKALRSGEYAQGRGVLCIPGKEYDKFCCLGVLCDLYLREGVGDMPVNTSSAFNDCGNMIVAYSYGRSADSYFPPGRVQEWAGLEEEAIETLASLNDDEELGFEEIADQVERDL